MRKGGEGCGAHTIVSHFLTTSYRGSLKPETRANFSQDFSFAARLWVLGLNQMNAQINLLKRKRYQQQQSRNPEPGTRKPKPGTRNPNVTGHSFGVLILSSCV